MAEIEQPDERREKRKPCSPSESEKSSRAQPSSSAIGGRKTPNAAEKPKPTKETRHPAATAVAVPGFGASSALD